jgi:hypothetical protein
MVADAPSTLVYWKPKPAMKLSDVEPMVAVTVVSDVKLDWVDVVVPVELVFVYLTWL